MARVLVTGAAGFVGRALVRALAEQGHGVTALGRADGDITDAATWLRLPAAEHVFHLAARTYVPDSWGQPANFIHVNVCGTARALDFCRGCGAHLVHMSSYVYGIPKRLPIREEDPVAPNNPYTASKLLAEEACRFYADSLNVPVTIVRPFNLFGPGQRLEFLIPTILDHIRRRDSITVKDLEPRRDYVFVDDLIDALMRSIASPGGLRLFNIGSGVSHSVGEIIAIAQSVAGTNLPVQVDADSRRNEIPDVRADISRARAILGWEPTTGLAQGLGRILREEAAVTRRAD